MGEPEKYCQGLQGLAKTHVVSEAATDAPFGQAGQPVEAFPLVIAQIRLQG